MKGALLCFRVEQTTEDESIPDPSTRDRSANHAPVWVGPSNPNEIARSDIAMGDCVFDFEVTSDAEHRRTS